MSGPFGSSQFFGVAAGAAAGYVPKGAIWLNGTDEYLYRTPSGAGNRKTYSFSCWAKISNNNTSNGYLIDAGTIGGSSEGMRYSGSSSCPLLIAGVGGSGNTALQSTALYRDPTAWQHVFYTKDTTDPIAADRVRMYVNGREIYDFDTRNNPALDAEGPMNNNVLHRIGAEIYASTPTQLYNGYISEVILLDGYARPPSDFGTEDANGVWIPKDPTDSVTAYKGTNGFWLDFATTSGYGAGTDASGNGNDFTANSSNFTYDRPADSGTDTGNLCTWNPLYSYTDDATATFSNGNLDWAYSGTNNGDAWGTIAVDSDDGVSKWVICATINRGGSNSGQFGMSTPGDDSGDIGSKSNEIVYNGYNDVVSINNSAQTAVTGGDEVRFEIDFTATTSNVEVFTDGVSRATYSWNPTGFVSPLVGRATGSATCTLISDVADMAGTVTTGFVTIATQNLPAPSITNPSLNVLPILYEGNGEGQRVGNFIPFTDSKTVDNSCRFDRGGSDYLNTTLGTGGDTKTWTLSLWIKRGMLSGGSRYCTIMAAGSDSSAGTTGYTMLRFNNDDTLELDSYALYARLFRRNTNRKFTHTDNWVNIIIAFDSTETSAGDRIKIYVNGVQETSFAASVDPALNEAGGNFGANEPQGIGTFLTPSGTDFFDGYMSEIVFVDGTALAPSSLGETDTSTNRWIPKDVSGLTFGSEGFYLPMTAGNQLGMDNKGGSNTEEDALEVFLCSFDGVDGATTATDASSYGTTMTFTSGAALSNAQSKWGTTSLLLDGTNDFVALSPDYLLIGPNTNFTFEAWIYLNSNTATMDLFALRSGAGNYYQLGLHFASSIGARFADGSGGVDFNQGSNSGWSTGQWYHIAYVKNGTAYAIYRDGTSIASTTDSHTWDLYGIAAATAGIGTADAGWGNFFDGYVSDARISMKAVYTANFTAPTGAFSAPTAANNFLPYDIDKINDSNQMYGTPTKNFSVLNPSDSGGGTISEGNLKIVPTALTGTRATIGIGLNTGKYYWESLQNDGYGEIGWYSDACNVGTSGGNQSAGVGNWDINFSGRYHANPKGGTLTTSSPDQTAWAFTTNDVVMCAYDSNTGNLWFGKNGTWFDAGSGASGDTGNPSTGANPFITGVNTKVFPMVGDADGTGGNNNSQTVNFGAWGYFDDTTLSLDSDADGYFRHTVPTDFKAINQDNLSENTAGITGFSWIKNRDAADDHILEDRVRGIYKYLISNDTDIEVTNTNSVQRFLQQGVQVGNMDAVNTSAESFVLWNWVANGTGTTNTEGTITSTVSANTTAGFSIATYTGSSNTTFGHGLSTAPKLVMIKRRDVAAQWAVWHTSLTSTQYYLNLDDAGAEADYGSTFISTSSTLVTIDASSSLLNNTGDTYVCYCWAEVEGYSKFGSYEGNTDNDGPFIYLGFKPSILIWKNIDSGSASWRILDNKRNPYNPVNHRLFPNDSGVESDNSSIDFTANGFKVITNSSDVNTNTIVYAAWAENPFGGSGVAQAKAR